MTPDEVHTIKFRRALIGKRGYDEGAVDLLIDRIESTLRGDRRITKDELVQAQLEHPPLGKRGYRKRDVDAFVQRVVSEWPVWS